MRWQMVLVMLVSISSGITLSAPKPGTNIKKSFLTDAMQSLDKSTVKLTHHHHHETDGTDDETDDETDEADYSDDDGGDTDNDNDNDNGDFEDDEEDDEDTVIEYGDNAPKNKFDTNNLYNDRNMNLKHKNRKPRHHKKGAKLKHRMENKKEIDKKTKKIKEKIVSGNTIMEKNTNRKNTFQDKWKLLLNLENLKNDLSKDTSEQNSLSSNLKPLRKMLVEDLRKLITMTHYVTHSPGSGKESAGSIAKIKSGKDVKSLASLMETANKLLEDNAEGKENEKSVSNNGKTKQSSSKVSMQTKAFKTQKNHRVLNKMIGKEEEKKTGFKHKKQNVNKNDFFDDKSVSMETQSNSNDASEYIPSDSSTNESTENNDGIEPEENIDDEVYDKEKSRQAFKKAAKKVAESLRNKHLKVSSYQTHKNNDTKESKNAENLKTNNMESFSKIAKQAENDNEDKNKATQSFKKETGVGPVLSSELVNARKAFAAAQKLVEAAKARLRLYSAEKTFLEKVATLLKSQETIEKKRKFVSGKQIKDKSGSPLYKRPSGVFNRLFEGKETNTKKKKYKQDKKQQEQTKSGKEKKHDKLIVKIKKPEKETSEELENAEDEAEHMEENVAQEQERLYANLQNGENFAENQYLGGYSHQAYPEYQYGDYAPANPSPYLGFNSFRGSAGMKKSSVKPINKLDNETAGMKIEYKPFMDQQKKKSTIDEGDTPKDGDDINIKTSYI